MDTPTVDTRPPCGQALTVVARIKAAEVAALDGFLSAIGADIADNPHIAFPRLTRVHFMRWVIVNNDSRFGPTLAFESNHDGTLDQHLDELIAVAGPALLAIYGHCEGFPAAALATAPVADQIKDFMKTRARPYGAFFRAYPGASAQELRENARIYALIQTFIDKQAPRWRGRPASELRAEIARFVAGQAGGIATLPPPVPRSWVDRLVGLLMESRVAQVLAVLIMLPLLLPWALVLLAHELSDHDDGKDADGVDHALVEQEDHKIQNQLTHVVEIKTGWFRLATLKIVLWAIDLLASHYFTRGALGGITSIHFARWVFIDDDRRLLFFSNYDGSWESYLGDFVDRASAGLSAVWSNTLGFPPTRLLVTGGANNEDDFKHWTRNHQLPTQVWYSAHGNESVQNILNNAAIHAALVEETKTKTGQPTTEPGPGWLDRL